MAFERHNSERLAEVSKAADALKEAIDVAVAAYSDDQKLGDSCDAYTTAAKGFAALILAERIRRSFSQTIDGNNGKSNESAEEKRLHAKQIRQWLSPWNFAFGYGSRSYQIRSHTNGTQGGGFRLRPYRMAAGETEPAKWTDILKIVASPTLCDVTEAIHTGRTF